MAYHPLNLALRFGLELAALIGAGRWAYAATADTLPSWARVAVAVATGLCLATLWGVFAVPEDPSRSGSAPVPTPGALRLALELAILGGGAYAFVAAGPRWLGVALLALVAIHYGVSGERIRWLLAR